MSQSLQLFFLFDDADEVFLDPIRKQLGRSFLKVHTIKTIKDVEPGQDRNAALLQMVEQSHLLVLLASANYWSSAYCELLHDQVLERMDKGKLKVAPVLVRAHDWQSELPDLSVLPKSQKDIKSYPEVEQDAVCLEVAQEIKKIAETIQPGQDQTTRINQLAESIYLLNYQAQRECVADCYLRFGNQFNPLNLFLIRGTPSCGHRLLVDILRTDYQIELQSGPFPFPLELVGDKSARLWNELKNALDFRELNYQDKTAIAKAILSRLEHENIILLFENIEQCQRLEILPAINDFWREINDFLEQGGVGKKIPHRFFIFLNDRASDDFTYERALFAKGQGDELPERVVQLLPNISPVHADQIDAWLSILLVKDTRFRDLWSELKAKKDRISPGPNGAYMRETVETIIDQLDLQPHKAEILKRLQLA